MAWLVHKLDRQAEAVLVLEHVGLVLIKIVPRAVAVGIGPVKRPVVVVRKAHGLHALLRRELPAAAELHVLVIASEAVVAAEIAALLRRVIGQRQREGHDVARRADDRRHERELLHVVGEIARARAPGALGLVGVIIFDAVVVAVGHGEIDLAASGKLRRDPLRRRAVRLQQERAALCGVRVPIAHRPRQVEARKRQDRAGRELDEVLHALVIIRRAVGMHLVPRQPRQPRVIGLVGGFVEREAVRLDHHIRHARIVAVFQVTDVELRVRHDAARRERRQTVHMREDLVFPAAIQGGIADVRVARIGRIRRPGEDAAPRDRPGALLLDDRRVDGHGELRSVHPLGVRLHPEQVAAVLERLEGIGRRVGISARRIEQVGRGDLVDRLLRRVHQKDRAVLLHDRRQAVQPHRKGEMIALERPVDEDALLHVVAKGLILQVDPVVDVCIEHRGGERFRNKGVGFFSGQRHGRGRVRKLRRHVGVERLGLVGGNLRPGNRNRRRNHSARILGRRCFCVFLFVRARRSCRLRTL